MGVVLWAESGLAFFGGRLGKSPGWVSGSAWLGTRGKRGTGYELKPPPGTWNRPSELPSPPASTTAIAAVPGKPVGFAADATVLGGDA